MSLGGRFWVACQPGMRILWDWTLLRGSWPAVPQVCSYQPAVLLPPLKATSILSSCGCVCLLSVCWYSFVRAWGGSRWPFLSVSDESACCMVRVWFQLLRHACPLALMHALGVSSRFPKLKAIPLPVRSFVRGAPSVQV